MRIGVASLILLGVSLAAPAAAQDERARIDDFAIAAEQATQPGELEQVGTPGESLRPEVQLNDHRVFVSQQPSPKGPVPQLSNAGEAPTPAQIGPAEKATTLVRDISNRGESRPTAIQHIAGADRCDPQLERSRFEECQRILERRAAEFSAPQPPKLSAEERLLAEQNSEDRAMLAEHGDVRVRYAAQGQPDAGLRSNQELAALVLEGPPSGLPPSAPAQPATEALADLLESISIQMQGAPVPVGN